MKITVVSVGADGRVLAEAEFGTFSANWDGEPPAAGQALEVELDIEETLVWGDTIRESAAAAPSDEQSGLTVLPGVLEDFFPDEQLAMVRIGTGLLQVETSGEPAAVGAHVELRTRDLTLHDVNL